MPEIRTAVTIINNMSAPLKTITASIVNLTAEFRTLQTATSTAVNTSSLNSGRLAVENINNSMKATKDTATNLLSTVKELAATYLTIQGGRQLLTQSDDMANIKARLALINDGKQSVDALNALIMRNANNITADYQQTADMIGKLGVQAANAFSSTIDIAAFADQINKHLKISGTSAQQAAGSIIQLTQAMSAGVLRGEELNSVMEGLPTVKNVIVDYFKAAGDTRSIKQIAEDGLITSDIVKKALYSAAAETDRQARAMGTTFSGVWNLFRNSATEAMQPVYKQLGELANSNKFKIFAQTAGQTIGTIGSVISNALSMISNLAKFATEHWRILQPIIIACGTAFTAYTAAIIANNIALGINAAKTGINAALTAILNARVMLMSGATISATIAQWGLNAALFAFPGTWIVIAIVAIIGAFYAAIAAINELTGTTWSATGIIIGCLGGLAATALNIVFACFNGIMQLLDSFCNVVLSVIEFIANCFSGGFQSIEHMARNYLASIASAFLEFGKIAAKVIDTVMGSNIGSQLTSWQNDLLDWGSNSNKKIVFERNIIANGLAKEGKKSNIERLNIADTYFKGYSIGDNLFGNSTRIKPPGTDLAKQMQSIMHNTAALNANTAAVKSLPSNQQAQQTLDSLSASEEDMKLLRDIAEREVINRFTTAEIKIDMTNNNNISNGMDIDGVMSAFTDKLYDTMAVAAEGVHI